MKLINKNNNIQECEIPCEIGENEKCAKCDEINNICSKCNEGYYLKDDENKKCEKCSVDNCKICDRTNTCFSCNFGYKLLNGKCEINYSFKAIYKSDKKDEYVKLISISSSYIKEMIIDGKNHIPCDSYTFSSPKNHTIYFLMNTIVLFGTFIECKNMISISFTSLYNTENVTNMNSLFYGCTSLESVDITNFNTKNVIYMNFMFYNCTSLRMINVSNFITSKVKYMHYMFSLCSSLTILDISSFNTENVEDMRYMFDNCNNLKSINVSKFDISKVKYMDYMFRKCTSLTSLDLSNFIFSNVDNMYGMFCGLSFMPKNFNCDDEDKCKYIYSCI